MGTSVLIAFLCGCLAFALYLLFVSSQGVRRDMRERFDSLDAALARVAQPMESVALGEPDDEPKRASTPVKTKQRPTTWAQAREMAENAGTDGVR